MRLCLIIFAAMGASLHAWAGGLSTTGGGSGVICFADKATADKYRGGDGTLKTILADAKSVQSLEGYEAQKLDVGSLMSPQGDWLSLLEKAHRNVRLTSPVFAFALSQSANLSEFASWKPAQRIAFIDDAHALIKLEDRCLRIMIARRTAQLSHKPNGPPTDFPKIKVEFIQDLFDRLDSLNKALLVFHEQLYILGAAIGHENSDAVRTFTRFFFYKDPFLGADPVRSYDAVFSLRQGLVQWFGDYPLFFISDVKSLSVLENRAVSAWSRHLSFIELLKKIRAIKKRCLDQGPFSDEGCAHIALASDSELTDEEAFLEVAYFSLDIALNEMNSEFLFHPYMDSEMLDLGDHALNLACDLIPRRLKRTSVAQKALKYCDHQGKRSKLIW